MKDKGEEKCSTEDERVASRIFIFLDPGSEKCASELYTYGIGAISNYMYSKESSVYICGLYDVSEKNGQPRI